MQLLLLFLALALSLTLSYLQTRQLVGGGSDHPTHLFLARAIRENKHRLFTKIPHLLNETHCSGSPLFLHWCLSFLSDSQILTVARWLNPVANAFVIAIAYVAASRSPMTQSTAGWISLILALTPQFHHAYSARNYGLSARPIGFLLFATLTTFLPPDVPYWESMTKMPLTEWMFFSLLGYLIWGFSTFAAQALLFIGTCMAVLYGDFRLVLITIGSAVLFVAINRAYALSYLKYTFLYIKAYASELAGVFILKKRYSVWRDLVYDIWFRMYQNPRSGTAYAYENPAIIAVLLNPLVLASVAGVFLFPHPIHRTLVSEHIAVSGAAVFFLTSFRFTRFLGEPERYLEMVTPAATIFGVWSLHVVFGMSAVYALVAYGLFWTVAQFLYARHLALRLQVVDPEIAQVQCAIQAEFKTEPVRFCSNDEQITKSLMNAPWSFVRIWSAEQRFGGVGVKEAFSTFPFLNRAPFERVLAEYRINACALNKSNFDTVFESPAEKNRLKLVVDTGRYRVYRIQW